MCRLKRLPGSGLAARRCPALIESVWSRRAILSVLRPHWPGHVPPFPESSPNGIRHPTCSTGSGRCWLLASGCEGEGMNQRVLIVDDNEDVRRILGLRLQHAGFEVGDAADGAEGLDAVRHEKWDLVLLDLIMPRMDGFAFLQALRATAGGPPVIVITQYDDTE